MKFMESLKENFDIAGFLMTIRTLGALLMANVCMQFINNSSTSIWKLLTLGAFAFIMLLATCFKWIRS